MVPVGFTLQPDAQFLDLLGPVIADADYYEVAPETLWRSDAAGRLRENGFHRRFLALRAQTGRPFVAHGVGLSPGGGAGPGEAARRRRWQRRIAADHAVFRFQWYTDHLGVSAPGGLGLSLPLPLLPTRAMAARLRRRLRVLRGVVPRVGLENSVSYFLLGTPLAEAALLREALQGPGLHLLLDLHNVYTMAENFGFSPHEYLDQLDLRQVIELHISGGAESDPRWLASRRVMRLDSHDHAVPEGVWRLLEDVAPRCPHLRGVTLERMEGTVQQEDVAQLHEELARARKVLQRLRKPAPRRRPSQVALRAAGAGELAAAEALLSRLHCARDPGAALQEARHDVTLPAGLRLALAAVDQDGLHLSALLVVRLRFERLLRGSPQAEDMFAHDPAHFAAVFRRYHEQVPPTAFFPLQEARLFDEFRRMDHQPGRQQ